MMMFEYYKDNEIGIYFNKMPSVKVRYILPYLTKNEEQEIRKKPFVCSEDLEVNLWDYEYDYDECEPYTFVIPAGYTWDGASIPKLFWRIIGSKEDNRFLIASLIHDVLCENHKYVQYDRYFADKVFEKLLIASGVSKFKARLMFNFVDMYQKFCGWEKC